MKSRARYTLAACMIAPGLGLLSGCSSGGSSNATVPAAAMQSASTKTASVAFSITLPRHASATSQARVPQYISEYTRSIVVTVASDGTPAAVGSNANRNCSQNSTSCTIAVNVPLGENVFTIGLYSAPNGEGSLLSSGSVTGIVVAGIANTFNVTFNPILTGLSFQPPSMTFVAGVPQVYSLLYYPLDPSGAAIVGPGAYTSPSGAPDALTFSSSDAAGHVAVSGAAVASPEPVGTPDAVQVSYDGTPPRGNYATVVTGDISGAPVPVPTATAAFATNANLAIDIPQPPAISASGGSSTQPINGPDANVWEAYDANCGACATGRQGYIEKIDVHAHTISAFAVPSQNFVYSLTSGPDGNIWFVEQNANGTAVIAGKSTLTGVVTEYPFPADARLVNPASNLVAPGSDGAVWFGGYVIDGNVDIDTFFRFAPDGTLTTYPLSGGGGGINVVGSGPKNSVYFIRTSGNVYRFGSIASDGTVSDTVLPANFQINPTTGRLIYGPDGNFYYGDQRISTTGVPSSTPPFTNKVNVDAVLTNGLMLCDGPSVCNPATGVVTTIPITRTGNAANAYFNSDSSAVLGSDGNLWFSNSSGNADVTQLIW